MTIALLRVMRLRDKAKENDMEERYTKMDEKDGVEVVITKNSRGYFCESWNGISWPYSVRAQFAAETEAEAIANCLSAIQDVD